MKLTPHYRPTTQNSARPIARAAAATALRANRQAATRTVLHGLSARYQWGTVTLTVPRKARAADHAYWQALSDARGRIGPPQLKDLNTGALL